MGDPAQQTSDDYSGKGEPTTLKLMLHDLHKHRRAQITRLDEQHGSPIPTYRRMSSPPYPSVQQVAELKQAATLRAEAISIAGHGELAITLPPNGVALIEVG